MKNKLFQLMFFVSILFIATNLKAQQQYSFFVAGHTYGTPGINNIGFHPPFKEKFEYIKSRDEIVFGVLTGDVVSPNPIAQDWDEIDVDIEELCLPVYFAVGNHDMEDRPLFESRYGATYYSFTYENDLFIVLDPNIDNWNISNEQLIFLQTTVEANNNSTNNIFVFFHQELWWENDNTYHNIKPNSFAGRADEINFWTEIEPLFHNLSNNVVLFAGDFGAASWSNDLMYDNYDNITFIGSGMGEGAYDGDNFIITNVNEDKTIIYDLICLNENFNCLGELTDYEISIPTLTDKTDINIYPNPASNYLIIDLVQLQILNNSIELYLSDIFGREKKITDYKFENNNNLQINTSVFSNGIYFLKIIINEKIIIKKITIMK